MALSIDQIPIPVPSSTDPVNFSARGDAVFGAFPDFITQTNAVASEAAVNKDLTEASKVAAANSETNAATYASNATTSANNASSSSTAPLWVSGTTYAINDKRVSPITGQVYRRKTSGAGTTDPSLDSTNWYAVLLDADTQYPSIKPTLNLDFANSGKLDPRITFTRASTATYWDGKTFAKAEENLLLRSQEFDNASWIKTNATVTANSTIAPDGTTTADTLLEAATTTTHAGYQAVSVAAAQYSFSVYLKDAGRSFALVTVGVNAVSVNLTLGTVSAANGTTSDRTIQSVGGGWYRVNFSVTTTAGNNDFVIYTSTDGVWANRVYAGDITKGLYLWGAQLEQRDQATAYTPTTDQPIAKYQPVLQTAASGAARFDHNPMTGESLGLLIEESRQNLLTYSEQFDNAAWTKTNCTISANAIVSLDGTIGAEKLIEASGLSAKYILRSTTLAATTSYTQTVYAKSAGRGVLQIASSTNLSGSGTTYQNFDLINGTLGSSNGGKPATITPVGNGWYRCSYTDTSLSAAIGEFAMAIVGSATATRLQAYTGDGFSGIYIWGAQLEAVAYPTSYIPTTTAQVTRAADSASMTGANFSSWYRQDEGTFYSDAAPSSMSVVNMCVLAATDGTTANALGCFAAVAPLYVRKDGVDQALLNSGVYSAGAFSKNAASYSLNAFAASLNSGTVASDSSGLVPSLSQLWIGMYTGNFRLNGHIKRIAYYPKRLPNYQLQILTK